MRGGTADTSAYATLASARGVSALEAATTSLFRHLRYRWALQNRVDLQISLDEGSFRSRDPKNRAIYTTGDQITGCAVVRSRVTFPLPCTLLTVKLVALVSVGYGISQRDWEVFSRILSFKPESVKLEPHATVSLPFAFRCAELVHDTYESTRVRCVYRVVLSFHGYSGLSSRSTGVEVVVRLSQRAPRFFPAIHFNAGLEDILNLELQLDRRAYSIEDVIVGSLTFLDNHIAIRRADIEIRRQESGFSLPMQSVLVGSFQVLAGSPKPACKLPIRIFLRQFDDLTPTYEDVCGLFSVHYMLRVVVTDIGDRRFWKEQPIAFWRAPPCNA
jgi:hypothetical protein